MGKRKRQSWLRARVAELKADLEKLPPERQEQFKRELASEAGPAPIENAPPRGGALLPSATILPEKGETG